MRLGSLCTGYGGLDMAVSAHYGADLAWYSEVDKDCNQLLAHHWPGVPNLGDLTTTDWDQVDPVDILCAGFPCQPFSHAGKREGENDDRAIFAYIADGISVLSPSVVVLENVAGILTLGGPGVIGTLAGLGYDLRWGVVRASDAGAPHRRARWFCIATNTGDLPRAGTVVGPLRPKPRDGHQGFGIYEPAIQGWADVVGRPAPDPLTTSGKLSSRFVEWMMGLDRHVCNLGLTRRAELRILGNGVCPQQAALALTLLNE